MASVMAEMGCEAVGFAAMASSTFAACFFSVGVGVARVLLTRCLASDDFLFLVEDVDLRAFVKAICLYCIYLYIRKIIPDDFTTNCGKDQ